MYNEDCWYLPCWEIPYYQKDPDPDDDEEENQSLKFKTMYKFSKESKEQLETCHYALQLIMETALKISPIDFKITEGYRSVEKQKQYYDEKKSKIDGITRKGKHNYVPSMACDIMPIIPGHDNWDKEHITFLAGLISGVAGMLHDQKKIDYKIRWGGNWDMDGIILLDQSFDDRPHFELIEAFHHNISQNELPY